MYHDTKMDMCETWKNGIIQDLIDVLINPGKKLDLNFYKMRFNE